MLIKTIIQKDDGTYEATMDLTEEQHAHLVSFAINVLMARGAELPMILKKIENDKPTLTLVQ